MRAPFCHDEVPVRGLSSQARGLPAKIMRIYKAGRKTYIACVWVVSTPRIKRHVETLLKQLGPEDPPRFIIAPLFNRFGEQYRREPWTSRPLPA